MVNNDFQLELEFKRLEEELGARYGSGSLYEGLGVKPGCTEEEINERFRTKAREHHPDVSKEPDAEARFKHITRINDVLSNPKKRASYDAWRKKNRAGAGERQQSPPPNGGAYSSGRGYGSASRGSSPQHGSGSRDAFSGSLESVVNNAYDGVRVVSVNNVNGGVILGLSQDGRVYVEGMAQELSLLDDGRLYVKGLEGKLVLPEGYDVLLGIKTINGSIRGTVAHGGIIKTTNGGIRLSIVSPLGIKTKTKVGDVNVSGMREIEDGVYIPPDGNYSETLFLKTATGDITLDYAASAARQGAGVRAR